MGCNPILEQLHCFQMRRGSQASSQSCRSVDADAWCKRARIAVTVPGQQTCKFTCYSSLVYCIVLVSSAAVN